MIAAMNDADDNNKRVPQERSILRILREQPAGPGTPAEKEGKRYAYLWKFASRRRKDGNWRDN